MANQRPINRRPWRRNPFRKNVRPKRWNASSTQGALEVGAVADAYPMPAGWGGPVLPIATIVSGQIDVEPWADEQEVRLDRVVGDLNCIVVSGWDSNETSYGSPPLIKLALLVNEEVTADASGQTLDLWDQETMEDYEWMWMWTGMPEHVTTRLLSGTTFLTTWMFQMHLDLRNRRKIGQSDELNLYGSYRPTLGAGGTYNLPDLYIDLRSVLVSK